MVDLACSLCFFFFQAEDGIRDLVRSRGLGDVYKRQLPIIAIDPADARDHDDAIWAEPDGEGGFRAVVALSLIHI